MEGTYEKVGLKTSFKTGREDPKVTHCGRLFHVDTCVSNRKSPTTDFRKPYITDKQQRHDKHQQLSTLTSGPEHTDAAIRVICQTHCL